MTDLPTVPALAELLGWRREFHAHPTAGDDAGLGDVVYVLARFLIRRFGITHLFADAAAALFQSHGELTVNGDAPPAVVDAESFNALYVFDAARPPAWAPTAVAAGSLVLAYGSSTVDDGAGVRGMAGMAGAVFVPLSGHSPALWRLAGHLITAAAQRAAAAAAVRSFAAQFAGDDLDPLRLAEEAMSLRAAVGRLSGPGTATADVAALKRTVADLEEDVLALRRTILNQELTIAALTAKGRPAAGAR